MDMAQRIKERRKYMGMTQEELALKLGMQKSAIAKYENGRVENIKRSTIQKMAEILDCSPAYLMGWEEITVEDNPVQISGHEKWYYEDPELAKEAQRMFEDADMRSLFHMKKNMSPDRFQKHVDMMKEMYRLEHPEEFPEEDY